MRYNLSTEGYSIREFANRLQVLNNYLPYFPPKTGTKKKVKKLDMDELTDILIRAQPQAMSIAMMKANIDPYTYTWDEIINYLERLELSMALEKSTSGRNNNQTDENTSGKKRKSRNGDNADTTDKKPNTKKKGKSKWWCDYCNTDTHNTENCWFKNENKNKTKNDNTGKAAKKPGKEATFTVEQMQALFSALPSRSTFTASRKKRKVHYESDSSTSMELP